MAQPACDFTVWPLSTDGGGGFLIEFPDLPGCMSDGSTIEAAIANGRDAQAAWIATMQEAGRTVPAGDRARETLG